MPDVLELPIDPLRERFLQELARAHVVVSAPTGSGKSTRVPVWAAENGNRVLVVEPRRVACRTLARWVASQLGTRLGREVGYSVRFESQANETTRIHYVTPGVALGYALENKLASYSTLVLDEFHERGVETDLLLALAPRLCPDSRLVVMSATLDGGRLAEFLGASWVQAEGRRFPVEVRYLGGRSVPSGRDLGDRVNSAVRQALKETTGSVLVFLPGLRSIGDCAGRVRGLGAEVVPLHGSLPHAEQDRAFEEGTRKIILSTNVAESSVTVPGVTAVVDSGLVKQHIHRSGHSALVTGPLSEASAEQRRGRAGRLCPGVCYRLWDQEGKLDATTPPELMRIELAELVLWTAAAGFPAGSLRWLDPPPEFALSRAQNQLRRWQALDDEDRLTPLGAELARTPLPAERAAWLVQAPPELAQDVADLCAALEARAPLFRGLEGLKPVDLDPISRNREKELPGPEPIQSILTLRRGDVRRHRLHPNGLSECRKIAEQLRTLRGLPELSKSADGRPDRVKLAGYLITRSPERAYVRRQRRDAWGNGRDEVQLKGKIDDAVQAAVMLEIAPISDRGLRVRLRARNALPCSFSQLLQAGLGEPVAERASLAGDRIQAEVSIQYGGREIGRTVKPLSGELLRRALARMVLDGRVFRGLADTIAVGCKLFSLHRALGEGTPEQTEPETWLRRRLEELGVEEDHDWSLLSREDLRFDELDEATMGKLRESYPPELSTGSARYEVEYLVGRRCIVLHWVSGIRNAPVSPMHLPRWEGWRVEVDERGRRTAVRG